VPITSSAWSTAGILSPITSIAVATANSTSALSEDRNWKDGPRSKTPSRARPPAANSGSQARKPAAAASAIAIASAGRNSASVPTSMNRD
jgi:hypothetical protein